MTTLVAAERPTRVRYAVLSLVFAAAFITYLDRVCISVAAPSMQADLGLTQLQFGWVFTAFYIAYGICEMPSAWLGDRWGQRRMLIRIVGCWSIFTILSGAARQFGTLIVTRTIFGAAEAGAFPTLSRALSRWFPAVERSQANGVMWVGARSGGAIAPPIAVLLIGAVGWRWAFAIFGAVGVAWVLVCLFWYRDDPADHPAVNAGELAIIRVGAAPAPKIAQRVPWRRMLTDPNMLRMSFTYFASGFGFQFFVTWLPTYFTKEFGVSLMGSGVYAALPLIAGAVGCFLGGVIADSVTRRTGSILLGRRTVGFSGFMLGALGYFAAISMRSPQAAVACLALASGAHDLTLPVLWATCTDAGGRFGGTSSGLVNLASSLSGVTAPLAAAKLAQMFGSFTAVFYVAAGLYVMAAITWLFIDPRKSIED
jgi:ACS family glucarate transporter-like MFS transporter